MTGTFQIRKQIDGGVQELVNADSKVVFSVNDPVSFSTDGTVVAYSTGDKIFGVNNSEMVAPEFYAQTDLDDIATTAVEILVSPVKEETLVEVIPAVAITDEDTIKAVIGQTFDFNASLELDLTAQVNNDARVLDYKVYTAKDGSLTINPIVAFLNTVY